MQATLNHRLRSIEIIEDHAAGCLRVFGLRWSPATEPAYRTLDEALAAGTLEVTEVNEGGHVPLLRVVNRGDEAVFLMAGEQLVGAKQNRILNTSILVPAKTELTVPVSCVEAGRWGYVSPKFGSGGTMSHGKLRKMMSEQVTASYAKGGFAESAQGEVWKEVSRKLHCLGSVSPSRALQQSYADYEGRFQEVMKLVNVTRDCCGAAFAIGGRVVGMDVFDRPSTLAKLWPKVARAYAIDGMEEKDGAAAEVSPAAVRDWLKGATDASQEAYKSPGLGEDVRVRGQGVVGGGLVVDGSPVHVELFAT